MNIKSFKLLISVLTVGFLLTLTGCLSNEIKADYKYNDYSTYDGDDIDVSIKAIKSIKGSTNKGILCFDVTVKNDSNKIIKIVFENSSLSYDKTTEIPFLSGQKYVAADTVQGNRTIPMNTTSSFVMYSAGEVRFNSKFWSVNPMSMDVTTTICLEIEGTEYYWVTNTKATEKSLFS